tara:strand:- start:1561 stop:1833 length:273 start_codon:yes stop_codon:yes gene_type:complete
MKKLSIFIISTLFGYYIGIGIAILIKRIAPEFFNVDPGLITIWFSNKPNISSQMLGYIIYSITSITMFFISTNLEKVFQTKNIDENKILN